MNAPLFKLFGKLDPWLDKIIGKETEKGRKNTYWLLIGGILLIYALVAIYAYLLTFDWLLRLKGYQ